MTFTEFFKKIEELKNLYTKDEKRRIFYCYNVKELRDCNTCPFVKNYSDGCSIPNRKKEYDNYLRVKKNLDQW